MKYRSLKSEVLQFLLTKGDRKGQGIFQFIYYDIMRDLSPQSYVLGILSV